MNEHTLFTHVQDYYTDLVLRLRSAEDRISMTYLSFDDGFWAGQISEILCEKVAAGLQVRLMVDEFGQAADNPRHMIRNQFMFNHLRQAGVQVDIFRPRIPDLHLNNRLHCKITAIDDGTVYLGGSNVGDYYTTWSDSNLRIDGELGDTFHKVYTYLSSFSWLKSRNGMADTPSGRMVGNDRLWLTVPHRKQDVRQALLDLILSAEKSIYIRTWYFLPDEEILDALCQQAERGVHVHVLLSHKTRVRPVDFANNIHIHRLVCAGGKAYRFAGRYMHAKAAWNDHGDVLFGSANLDPHSMAFNFESCMQINSPSLAWDLYRAFQSDLHACLPQTPDSYRRLPLHGKVLTHACNMASPWL